MQTLVFFHQFSNGRRRKKTIIVLDSESGDIRGHENITNHIVDYYKHLFGHNDPCYLRSGEEFWPQELRLNDSEKESLICPFSMEEQLLEQVIDNVKKKKCPDWKKQLIEQQVLKFTEKFKPQVITALKYSPTLETAVKNSKGKTNLPPTLVKKIQMEDREMQKIIQNMENELIDLICNDMELHANIMEALTQETEERELQFKRRKMGS